MAKPNPKTTPTPSDAPRVPAIAFIPDRLGRHVVELRLPPEVISEYQVKPAEGPHDMAMAEALALRWARETAR